MRRETLRVAVKCVCTMRLTARELIRTIRPLRLQSTGPIDAAKLAMVIVLFERVDSMLGRAGRMLAERLADTADVVENTADAVGTALRFDPRNN